MSDWQNLADSIAIAAIVPARNEEESVARCVESLAAQEPIGEIIVVNDQSSDGTGRVLAELAARVPKLRVIESNELPEGWVGKNYAASLGAKEARGEWLLFTDADAVHLPESAARALADAERTGAELVSYSPAQEMKTRWERAMIPFVFARLAQKYRYAAINDARSPMAAANGQYLMIQREAYEAVGGHGAVRGEVLEDVALARLVKESGRRIYFAPGPEIARVRMYGTFGAMWQGWVKNLYPLMRRSDGDVWREIVTTLPWIPALLLIAAPLGWLFPALGLALLLGRHVAYARMLRASQFPASGIQYYLPAVVMYCAALATSARRYAKGSVEWKGREYAVHS
jgi:glycosyltransferase involved in cell wall biosynthesis